MLLTLVTEHDVGVGCPTMRIDAAKGNVGRAMILVESAEGHTNKGEIATAVGELQEAVTLSPDFTEAQYQLGWVLLKSPNGSSQAEAAFQRVLQLNSNDASAYLQLALLLEAHGDEAQAFPLFAKAVQLAPGLIEGRLGRGRLAKGFRDWTTAVRELQAVLVWNPDDAEAHYDLAGALKASGQLEEAAHELQIAQRLKPELATPR